MENVQFAEAWAEISTKLDTLRRAEYARLRVVCSGCKREVDPDTDTALTKVDTLVFHLNCLECSWCENRHRLIGDERVAVVEHHQLVCALHIRQDGTVKDRPKRRTCRKRVDISRDNRHKLETFFEEDNFPTKRVRERIAQELGYSGRTVEVWFQNHRRRTKQSAAPSSAVQIPSADPTAVAAPKPQPCVNLHDDCSPQAPDQPGQDGSGGFTTHHQQSHHGAYSPQAPQHLTKQEESYSSQASQHSMDCQEGYDRQAPPCLLNHQDGWGNGPKAPHHKSNQDGGYDSQLLQHAADHQGGYYPQYTANHQESYNLRPPQNTLHQQGVCSSSPPHMLDHQANSDPQQVLNYQASSDPQQVLNYQARSDPQQVLNYQASSDPQQVLNYQASSDPQQVLNYQANSDPQQVLNYQASNGPQQTLNCQWNHHGPQQMMNCQGNHHGPQQTMNCQATNGPQEMTNWQGNHHGPPQMMNYQGNHHGPPQTMNYQASTSPQEILNYQASNGPQEMMNCQANNEPPQTMNCQANNEPSQTMNCQWNHHGPSQTMNYQASNGPQQTMNCQWNHHGPQQILNYIIYQANYDPHSHEHAANYEGRCSKVPQPPQQTANHQGSCDLEHVQDPKGVYSAKASQHTRNHQDTYDRKSPKYVAVHLGGAQ